jgi:uncharacterized protein (TIGR02246 family)
MRVILSFLLGLVLAGCASAPMGASNPESVAAATAAWVAAYNSRDPARITAMYEPDAVLWGTSAKTIAKSPQDIAEYFKGAPGRPQARVVITDQAIRVNGDTALSTGSYTFSDMRDGQRIDRPSRFSFVLRQRAGQWRILHHHSSSMPS